MSSIGMLFILTLSLIFLFILSVNTRCICPTLLYLASPTPIGHTFCIILDDAYYIKMDVDWSEELKRFFLSEVN